MNYHGIAYRPVILLLFLNLLKLSFILQNTSSFFIVSQHEVLNTTFKYTYSIFSTFSFFLSITRIIQILRPCHTPFV